jgi:hypothetical protein
LLEKKYKFELLMRGSIDGFEGETFLINAKIKERQLLLSKLQMEKYLEAILIWILMVVINL